MTAISAESAFGLISFFYFLDALGLISFFSFFSSFQGPEREKCPLATSLGTVLCDLINEF